jgi:hypothetical protein
MGAESTAGIYRMLTDPTSRPDAIAPDYSNLVVVIAQTGDEWSTTGQLVEQHILPVIRARNVRLVEVARKGPTKRHGVAVLQDTRQPYRLHLEGVYKLSDENRVSGTMPQLGGVRKCSQKAKGAPLDWWRSREFGDRQYIHAIGFNLNEDGRIARDKAYSMGGQRIPSFPIHDWSWTREDCLDYLWRKLGVVWPKSCCRQCPYAGCVAGWPDQLTRFKTLPDEAAQHVIDEYVCLSLNPRSGLFGPGKSLIGRLERDKATEVLRRAAERMKTVPWSIYHVRRFYTSRAHASRSVDAVFTGERLLMYALLDELSDLAGISLTRDAPIDGAPVRAAERDHRRRLWLRRRATDRYPAMEEFYVAAPAQVLDKAPGGFDDIWTEHTDALHLYLERRTNAAILVARRGLHEGQFNDSAP